MSRYATLLLLPLCTILVGADWNHFRGSDGSGIGDAMPLPTQWSADSNIAWKAPLPGRGLASPIVVKDRVFVTASSGFRQDRLHVLCFDAKTGQSVWERAFWATGRTFCHPKTCVAASSPCSDGERVFALFSTNDLVCLDLDGNLLWLRGLTTDYVNASNGLGMASSPRVIGKTLIVQLDNDSSQSITCGIDVLTGINRWLIDRPSMANWTSPLPVPGVDGKPSILLQSAEGLAAHDPDTGEKFWSYAKGCSTIPSSATNGSVVVAPSQGLTAIRFDAAEREPREVLWNSSRLSPATASPVIINDRVYVLNRSGVLNCADLKTGELVWQLRLEGQFSATPVASGDRLYFFNENGLGQVVQIGDKPEIIGKGNLGETILGTPAIADGGIYVRSDAHLWKIADAKAAK